MIVGRENANTGASRRLGQGGPWGVSKGVCGWAGGKSRAGVCARIEAGGRGGPRSLPQTTQHQRLPKTVLPKIVCLSSSGDLLKISIPGLKDVLGICVSHKLPA